ncbi:EP300-interacting inhibitor of differentiation 2B [Cavia porcellus]|uniref:EP300-interacting inhibitor of differentiation 2B n=1 Tax=Cavia porcellus TaxID=10141 RepID=UPI0003512341|nr:EP300-interacting inhibitor of differentiation 2B [Cavia porcellus]
MGAVSGIGHVLQMGVGGRRRAQESQEGPGVEAASPMARVRDRLPGRSPATNRADYLNNSPMIPVRIPRDIEERCRLFVEDCSATEAAFDANPPEMDADAVAFALAVTAAADDCPLAN